MLKNKKWLSGEEIMNRWQVSQADFKSYLATRYATKTGELLYLDAYHPQYMGQVLSSAYPAEDHEQARMSEIIQKGVSLQSYVFPIENILEFENHHGIVVHDEPSKSLGARELRELGRLRQRGKKWIPSIKAAVHAALLCQNKKIKRDELKNELDHFDLTDVIIDEIWIALREKGLTKGAGRPKKSSK
jgi:hypothetical protein